jgi:hypothetical protein
VGEGRCKDCKWWTPPSANAHVALWLNNYNFRGFGGCELTAVEGGARDSTFLALAYDDEHTFGILCTKPEFGCVQFEKKAGDNG